MYSFHKQVHSATGVQHSIYCNFYNLRDRNLVIAGPSQLRVFNLIKDDNNEQTDGSKMKLECKQSFNFHGEISSVQSVRLPAANRDSLLLSFRDAKLSIVEYDENSNDLRTVSLHYYEDDESIGGRMQIIDEPIVRVDTENRCAAMLIYGRQIIVLPFRKEFSADNPLDNTTSPSRNPSIISYKIKISEMDVKIANVIDFQFLHGYYEPTLLVLFEPIRTWAGRVAIRQDTCSMVAISLNIQQKVHPVIWSCENLPFDCTQALAVPKPIGGVLIFAVNSLLYLNQSIPPFGVSLNSMTEGSTAYPLKVQDGVKISLDCAVATFISLDSVVICLQDGQLYILTLVTDGMRSVRSFNIEKAAASVLTSCMTLCKDGYLFLGSRLGNSLLLKYTEKVESGPKAIEPEVEEKKEEPMEEKENEEPTEEKEEEAPKAEPPSKKKRLDTLGDWMASNVSKIQDPEELEVYGSEKKTSTQIAQYSFEVCDSLVNIGPLSNASMGEPAFLSEEYSNSIDPDVELVCTTGYGKNGALSVLQRTIRPQVVTTFELPGCTDMWTVIGPASSDSQAEKSDDDKKDENEDDDESKVDLSKSHAFLIISRNDSSMILQTGAEINELGHSGFLTASPTVFAGNICNNKFIVQVSADAIRLLEGDNLLQNIPVESSSKLVQASIADPFLLTLGSDGQITVLILREIVSKNVPSARFVVSKPQLESGAKINHVCAYTDYSGLFTTTIAKHVIEPIVESGSHSQSQFKSSINQSVFSFEQPNEEEMDEDDLLYLSESKPASTIPGGDKPNQSAAKSDQTSSDAIEATPWMFVCREDNCLQIYSLPDAKLVYSISNFSVGFKLLFDSFASTSIINKLTEKQSNELPKVCEILMVGLGHQNKRPILIARLGEDIVIYEAFAYYDNPVKNHLKLRFSKISHDMITRERKSHRSRRQQEDVESEVNERQTTLRYFKDIAGYCGVFVCGAYPYWIFLTSHGELRFHAMPIDGKIPCFASFHNVNCIKGFLYFNKTGELRICVLPTHLSYDAPWPVRKVPLRCTPHFVTYHVESKTYCVVTSTSQECTHLVKHTGEEKELEEFEKDDRFIYPKVSQFSLELYSPVSWQAIPNTKYELEQWEHVTAMKNVCLASEGTMSGLKGYIAVATNYNYGEDVTSRGRILISDIIDVVPEPGQPLTKNKMKMIYSKEQKGPVTTLCQVNGFLLSSIGQKIYIWQLKDRDLVGIAFIDTNIYIHTAVSIKNIIIVADICKSVTLLCFQEQTRTLALVSKDVKPTEIYSVEYFVDNNQLGFLVSDVDKNIVLYTYQPEAHESFGGQYLLRKGDIHIGSLINSFLRIRCKLSNLQHDKKALMTAQKRHMSIYFTQDGSIGSILPVSEKVYRRLLMLQNLMTNHLAHLAGLNPKAYRLYQSRHKQLMNPCKNILDGDLLFRFLNLSVLEKAELAKKIGSHVSLITDDLMEVDRCMAHF